MSLPPPTPKQARVVWFALTSLAVAVLVVLAVALIWGLGKVLHILAPVLWPLAVAGVIAYLLDPVVDFLQRKGVPRTRAIIFVFAVAIVFLLGLIASVVPQVITETRDLAERVPNYATNLQHRIEHQPARLTPKISPERDPARSDQHRPGNCRHGDRIHERQSGICGAIRCRLAMGPHF
jgi:predicted PurR-regulated permease PerM